MAFPDYQSTVSVPIKAEEAFGKIARVSEWWTKGTTGDAKAVGDAFKVDWGETWVDFRIVEAVPARRIVWQVTDCHLPWLKDKAEWKGTKVVWELATTNGTTEVTLTHVGLTSALECFDGCEAGWNFYFGKSLLKLFTDNGGCRIEWEALKRESRKQAVDQRRRSGTAHAQRPRVIRVPGRRAAGHPLLEIHEPALA